MTLDKMIQSHDDFTPIENQIAQYVMHHKRELLEMTITDLEQRLYISKSAIHRFCRKLGFKGFNELKVHIAKEIQKQEEEPSIDVNFPFSPMDVPSAVARKLHDVYSYTIDDTLKCLDEKMLSTLAKQLSQAQYIDIYTHAHNYYIAQNFRDKMLSIGHFVQCLEDPYNQRLCAQMSNSDHVAIFLSYSGKATFMEPVAKKLSQNGTKIIQIGRLGSRVLDEVDAFIPITDAENEQARISQFASHVGMLYCMDVLFGCIFNVDCGKNISYAKDALDYLDDRF